MTVLSFTDPSCTWQAQISGRIPRWTNSVWCCRSRNIQKVSLLFYSLLLW